MKFLINIALGKSIFSTFFFIAMASSIISAVYYESTLTINIALIFVAIFGLFIIIAAFVSSSDANESLSWPRINAELDICKVSTHSVGQIGSESYYPTVTYSFTVNNKKYSGKRYSLGDRTYSRLAAEKIINSILLNKENFEISYNPEDPSINVVKPGVNEVHLVRALTGLAVFIFSLSELFNWTNFI